MTDAWRADAAAKPPMVASWWQVVCHEAMGANPTHCGVPMLEVNDYGPFSTQFLGWECEVCDQALLRASAIRLRARLTAIRERQARRRAEGHPHWWL